jgi:hypothetical protein
MPLPQTMTLGRETEEEKSLQALGWGSLPGAGPIAAIAVGPNGWPELGMAGLGMARQHPHHSAAGCWKNGYLALASFPHLHCWAGSSGEMALDHYRYERDFRTQP